MDASLCHLLSAGLLRPCFGPRTLAWTMPCWVMTARATLWWMFPGSDRVGSVGKVSTGSSCWVAPSPLPPPPRIQHRRRVRLAMDGFVLEEGDVRVDLLLLLFFWPGTGTTVVDADESGNSFIGGGTTTSGGGRRSASPSVASGGSEDLFDELEGFLGVTLRTCTASVSVKDMAAAVEVVGALTRRSVRLTTAVSKQSAAQVRGLGAKLLLMWMLVCEA